MGRAFGPRRAPNRRKPKKEGGTTHRTAAAAIVAIVALALSVGNVRAVSVIAPSHVAPGEPYSLTVLSQPTENGTLSLADGFRPYADLNFTTDGRGMWVFQGKAPAKGTTLSFIVIMNASGSWSGTITVVAPSCTVENAPSCLGFLRAEFWNIVFEVTFLLAIVMLLLNIPNLAFGISRYQREAKLRGAPSIKEIARSPFRGGWVIVPPARNTPAVLPNERIALELKRRERLDELRSIASYARKFSDERLAALVQKLREVVEVHTLERSVLHREDRVEAKTKVGE